MKHILKTIIVFALFACYFPLLQSQQVNRIVSLVPSLTKNLIYLNVQDKIVGCTSFCEIKEEENVEIVASAIKVNVEKVASLAPDLVLATGITDPEVVELLKKLGFRVETFLAPTSFEEMCAHFLELGKILGEIEEAEQIVAQSKETVDSIKMVAQTKTNSTKIFFQIGAKPLYTVFPNTYMDDYIRFLGAKNIAFDFNKGAISRESVLARNPDVILIVTMGVVGEEEKTTWENYTELNAAKNNQIYIIDADLACTPTPITFVQTLRLLAELLTPTP